MESDVVDDCRRAFMAGEGVVVVSRDADVHVVAVVVVVIVAVMINVIEVMKRQEQSVVVAVHTVLTSLVMRSG